MPPPVLLHDPVAAIAAVPPGTWGVAVSGGADSVALLCLLRDQAQQTGDLRLHVIHLDHETRGPCSAEDAAFVVRLAAEWEIPCTMELRSRVESGMARLSPNPSARYRAARLKLFRQVVEREKLAGVILAHHADDQAETVFLRLLRGSGPMGLGGMSARTRVHGVTLLRPLLGVLRESLRSVLSERGQTWREDASNQSPVYGRNRVRKMLATRSELRDSLLGMGGAFGELRQWVRKNAPRLPAEFEANVLCRLPDLLAREAARRWLVERGCPAAELAPEVLDRLLIMARDAGVAPRAHFPGAVLVRRRRGVIFV